MNIRKLPNINFKLNRTNKLAIVIGLLAVGLGLFLVVGSKLQSFLYQTAGYSSEVTQLSPASYVPSGTADQVLGISIDSKIGFIDERAYVLDQYFKADKSPLFGYGHLFTEACDKYGAPKDCTTVAAIARAETDLCKYLNSAEYHNCWGFGGGGTDRIKFGSWEESIDLVTNRLVTTYGVKYMIDPSLMERTFCGTDAGCTGWGKRIKFYMQDISDYAKKVGLDHTLFDLR